MLLRRYKVLPKKSIYSRTIAPYWILKSNTTPSFSKPFQIVLGAKNGNFTSNKSSNSAETCEPVRQENTQKAMDLEIDELLRSTGRHYHLSYPKPRSTRPDVTSSLTLSSAMGSNGGGNSHFTTGLTSVSSSYAPNYISSLSSRFSLVPEMASGSEQQQHSPPETTTTTLALSHHSTVDTPRPTSSSSSSSNNSSSNQLNTSSSSSPNILQFGNHIDEIFKCFICLGKAENPHLCPYCSKMVCYDCMKVSASFIFLRM